MFKVIKLHHLNSWYPDTIRPLNLNVFCSPCFIMLSMEGEYSILPHSTTLGAANKWLKFVAFILILVVIFPFL